MKLFDKLNKVLEKYFVPVANKIAAQRHVMAIKDGIVVSMPLTIIGSVFLILGFLPFPGYREFLEGNGIATYLSYVSDACFGIVGIVAALAVAYRLSNIYKMNELSLANGVIALLGYFITIMPILDSGKLGYSYLGARSLFTGVVIALISVEIVKIIVDRGIVISLPESVPPAIGKTFMALIPGFIVATFWGVITVILVNTSFKNFHDAINIIVGMPLRYVGSSLGGQLVAALLNTLLWSTGIHGATIVGAFMDPIYLENSLSNMSLVSQGIDNIYSNGYIIPTGVFKDLTVTMGGSGSTIGLALLMLFKARSKQMKEIGKIAITPSLFNINEPIIFGLPIVMNPILMVPFIMVPLVTTTVAWFAMKWDLVKIPFAALPWTTPPVLSTYLASGFAISGAVIAIINLSLSVLIFYPFFKLYDSQLVEQENNVPEEESLEDLLGDLEF